MNAPVDPGMATRAGFALMLETACEDFEILQRMIRHETQVISTNQRDSFRAGPRIEMALAKSFVFNAVRARRICEHGANALSLGRLERTRFLKGTEELVGVRDVNEHGFDVNGKSKPSNHFQEGGILDETSLAILGDAKILMGPLNLSEVYIPVAWMRSLAGFASIPDPNMPPAPEPPPSMRLFPCLEVLLGSDKAAQHRWLTTYNAELGCVPGEKTKGSIEGLAEVVSYLEALIRKNEAR